MTPGSLKFPGLPCIPTLDPQKYETHPDQTPQSEDLNLKNLVPSNIKILSNPATNLARIKLHPFIQTIHDTRLPKIFETSVDYDTQSTKI